MGIPLWPSDSTTTKAPHKTKPAASSSSTRLRTVPITLPSGLTITVSRPESPYRAESETDPDTSDPDSDSDDDPDPADSEAENNVYRALMELHRQEQGGIPASAGAGGDRLTLIEFLRAEGRRENLLAATASRPGTSSTITPQSQASFTASAATSTSTTTPAAAAGDEYGPARRRVTPQELSAQITGYGSYGPRSATAPPPARFTIINTALSAQLQEQARQTRARLAATQSQAAALMAEARQIRQAVRTQAEAERAFEVDRQRRAGARRREERERMETEAGTVLNDEERMREAQAQMVAAMVQAMHDGGAVARPGESAMDVRRRVGTPTVNTRAARVEAARSRVLVGRLADLMEGLVMTTEGIQDICDALEGGRPGTMRVGPMNQSVRHIERGVAGIAREVERLVPEARSGEGDNEDD